MNCVSNDSMGCCIYLVMSILSVNRRAGLFVSSLSANNSINNSWVYDAGDVLETARPSPSITEVLSTAQKIRQAALTFHDSQMRVLLVQQM